MSSELGGSSESLNADDYDADNAGLFWEVNGEQLALKRLEFGGEVCKQMAEMMHKRAEIEKVRV
jgi:hypothetical protein